ncbi:MAG: hypothetical protein AAGA84_04390 [Pseudomonadota bacterium]
MTLTPRKSTRSALLLLWLAALLLVATLALAIHDPVPRSVLACVSVTWVAIGVWQVQRCEIPDRVFVSAQLEWHLQINGTRCAARLSKASLCSRYLCLLGWRLADGRTAVAWLGGRAQDKARRHLMILWRWQRQLPH